MTPNSARAGFLPFLTHFNSIDNLAVSSLTGDIWFIDQHAHMVGIISPQGCSSILFTQTNNDEYTGTIRVIAGSGRVSVERDGKGTEADLGYVFGICVDKNTECAFVTCFHDGAIKKVYPDGIFCFTLAIFWVLNLRISNTGTVSTLKLSRKLERPAGITLDRSGNSFIVAESGKCRIVRLSPQ